jgi:hypothetical protein
MLRHGRERYQLLRGAIQDKLQDIMKKDAAIMISGNYTIYSVLRFFNGLFASMATGDTRIQPHKFTESLPTASG